MCFVDCISTLHSRNELSCRYFSFFTELTYIGLVSYFWASSVQTFFFARSRAVYPLQNWPRPLQFLHLLLHTTIVTYPIIVTAVFWGLIATPETFSSRWSAWVNISEHALNTVFAAFEIFCTNASPSFGANPQGLSMPWIHLPFLIILLAGYLGVAYITHATQGFYSMSFPETKLPFDSRMDVDKHVPQRTASSILRRNTANWQRTLSELPSQPSSYSSSYAMSAWDARGSSLVS